MSQAWLCLQALYSLWQYELCDVFIELIKPVMADGDAQTQQATRETLYTCLDQGLRCRTSFCCVTYLVFVKNNCVSVCLCYPVALNCCI